jgi:integrase
MGSLAAAWYAAPTFTALKASAQRTYRAHLERFLATYKDDAVADVQARHLLSILDKRAGTPAAANALRNVLRQVFQFAFERGWRGDNPMRDVRRIRYEKKPFRTWSEDDIAAFEARWSRGTRARLALDLLLYTGQRRSDVIRMGPQHVRGDTIMVKQVKTGTMLALPLHPELRASLAELKGDHLAFLMTELGAPFASPTAFYNWFVDCAAKAGLPKGLSPHGLRKSTVCRLLEAGATPHQVMSITGHKSLAEIERYAAEVNQPRLAAAAVVKLGKPRKEQP